MAQESNLWQIFNSKIFFSHYDKEKDFWKFFGLNLASGGLAGGSTAIFVYPLDYARTRLSTDVGKGSTREFKGLGDVLKKTFKSDGFIGCYRGFNAYVGGIILYRAGYFGLFDTAKLVHGKELSFLWAWAIAQVCVSGIKNWSKSRFFLQKWIKIERTIDFCSRLRQKSIFRLKNGSKIWLKIYFVPSYYSKFLFFVFQFFRL